MSDFSADGETISKLMGIIRRHSKGISTSGISRESGLNRNSVSKYLEILVILGHLDVNPIGNAKIYSVARRVPVVKLLDNVSDSVILIDSDEKINFLNNSYADLAKIKKDEFLSLSLDEANLPYFPTELYSLARGCIAGEKQDDLVRSYGIMGDLHLKFHFIPVVFGKGHKGAAVIIENISREKKLESSLHEINKKYFELFNSAEVCIILSDPSVESSSGKIIDANNFACNFFGLERDLLVGMNTGDLLHSLRPAKISGDCLLGADVISYEGLIKKKNSPDVKVSVDLHQFFNGIQNLEFFIIRDLTETGFNEDIKEKYEGKLKKITSTVTEFADAFDGGELYRTISRQLALTIPKSLVIVGIPWAGEYGSLFYFSDSMDYFEKDLDSIIRIYSPDLSDYSSKSSCGSLVCLNDIIRNTVLSETPEGNQEELFSILNMYRIYLSVFTCCESHSGSIMVCLPGDKEIAPGDPISEFIRFSSLIAARNAEVEILKAEKSVFEKKLLYLRKNLIRINDVTNSEVVARVYAERAFQERVDLLFGCFEIMDFSVAGVDQEGKIRQINTIFSSVLGYDENEALEKSWAELLFRDEAFDEALYFQQRSSDRFSKKPVFSGSVICRDGSVKDMVWVGFGLLNGMSGEKPFFLIGEEAPGDSILKLFGY
ncbi:PAS domain-containing protein [Methanochimaera problematica]|nr:PAS domain S-box protein [Methanoplanus sp. FWC-SCC4]